MKIKHWLTCVQDRAKWKDVVEKAKTSNKRGSALEKEEEEKEKEEEGRGNAKWRKLHNEKVHEPCSSPDIIRVIKWRRMR